MNILFIDDHPEFLREMAEQLEDHGHTVIRCMRADDAVAQLTQIKSFGVVVLDIMMRLGNIIDPNEATETGIAIYLRLRKVAPNIPVLVVSALAKDRFWDESGFSKDTHASYFAKPLKGDQKIYQLVEMVKK